ncbi:hypothetical protein FB45DRAFT_865835 [Roridomyces roridus]|uniref:Uncharacterized protein n=1 Tax=Roridomyces roridus TaxID=1738132 RepID=A0AAD7FRQ5_9AGAR|nr:hypothetical protein FB45DRAFT_865835 [Roridomyces roridus]
MKFKSDTVQDGQKQSGQRPYLVRRTHRDDGHQGSTTHDILLKDTTTAGPMSSSYPAPHLERPQPSQDNAMPIATSSPSSPHQPRPLVPCYVASLPRHTTQLQSLSLRHAHPAFVANPMPRHSSSSTQAYFATPVPHGQAVVEPPSLDAGIESTGRRSGVPARPRGHWRPTAGKGSEGGVVHLLVVAQSPAEGGTARAGGLVCARAEGVDTLWAAAASPPRAYGAPPGDSRGGFELVYDWRSGGRCLVRGGRGRGWGANGSAASSARTITPSHCGAMDDWVQAYGVAHGARMSSPGWAMVLR